MDDIVPKRNIKKKCYSQRRSWSVKVIYIILIIIWIAIVLLFQLYKLSAKILLLIPILLFIFTIFNSKNLSEDVEEEMTRIILFPMMVVVGLALFTWMHTNYLGDKNLFMKAIFIAIILIMFSSYDLWTSRKNLFVVKHLSSGLQTMSLTIMIIVIISFVSINYNFN